MQPTLKKVHSMDYAASGGQQHGMGVVGGGTTTNRSNAPLMHSISIVVELAREQQPSATIEQDLSEKRTDMSRNLDLNSSPSAPSGESITCETISPSAHGDNDSETKKKNDEEEEDEEEDDDDDGRECLSTDLARKVVIVDEADKILRTRAASAEPRSCSMRSPDNAAAALVSDTTSNEYTSTSTVVTTSATPTDTTVTTPTRQRTISPLSYRRHTTMRSSTITGRETLPISRQQQVASSSSYFSNQRSATTCSSTCGGSGELAERGELSKLSMRRNTHHHGMVNPVPLLSSTTFGNAMRSSMDHPIRPTSSVQPTLSSGSAQPLENSGRGELGFDPILSGGKSISHTIPPNQHKHTHPSGVPIGGAAAAINSGGAGKNWSQRRQSLQISLLTGGCCSPSKSLTEEELRGEREFNEQVRSAKSPDIFSHQSPSPVSIVARKRCQSIAGGGGVGSGSESESEQLTTTTTTSTHHQYYPHSIVRNQQQQQRQQHHHRQSQRRVSFSSIDPILLHSEQVHGRASFAFYPTTSNYYQPHSPDNTTNSNHRLSIGSVLDHSTNNNNSSSKNTSPNLPITSRSIKLPASPNLVSPRKQITSPRQQEQHYQTGCVREDKQKRHSIAASNTATAVLSGNSSTTTIGELLLREQSPRELVYFERDRPVFVNSSPQSSPNSGSTRRAPLPPPPKRNNDFIFEKNIALSDETKSMTTTSPPPLLQHQQPSPDSIRKMNDNNNIIDEQKHTTLESSSLSSSSVEPQMEPFPTKLEGHDVDDHRITSSTIIRTQVVAATLPKEGNRVQSIMANAKLRQEEFARLLEEHEQIVNEINRVETKISNSQTSLQQQLPQKQQQQPQPQPQPQSQENKQ